MTFPAKPKIFTVLVLGFCLGLTGLTMLQPIKAELPQWVEYNWSSTHLISEEPTLNALRPAIAADDDNNVHIIWQDTVNYNGAGTDVDVFYRRWNESIRTWTTTEVISTDGGGNSQRVAGQVDEAGNFYVVWLDNSNILSAGTDTDVFLKLWNRTTGIWGSTEVVSEISTAGVNWPNIAIFNGHVYVVWQDNTNYLSSGGDSDIFYRVRSPEGSWNSTEVISAGHSEDSRFPSIYIDSYGNAHVVWDRGGNWWDNPSDVFYRYRNVTTSVWSASEILSPIGTTSSTRAKIIVDTNNSLHVVWSENSGGETGDSHILYTTQTSSSSTWTIPERISSAGPGVAEVPTIALDSYNNLHCFWFNGTQNMVEADESNIFYNYRMDATSSWNNSRVVIDSNEKAWRPNVVLGKDNVLHVVWQDRSPDYGGSDTDVLYTWGTPVYPVPVQNSDPTIFFVNSPDDITYEVNTTGHFVSWTVGGENLESTTYSLLSNGTETTNGTWTPLEPITIDINGYSPGSYNLTLFASGGENLTISDSVILIVLTESEAHPNTLSPLTLTLIDIGFGSLIAVGVGVISIVIIRRRYS